MDPIELKPGDQAPVFKGLDQNGQEVSLSDYKGKKVILYFYPKDSTPGCTTEACNFRDNYESLQAEGLEVIGVSTDSQQSHQKFIAKHDLPFTLIADEDKAIVQAYGVYGEKKFMGKKYMGTTRRTFLIDENGIITHVIKKVDNKNASQQVRDLLSGTN